MTRIKFRRTPALALLLALAALPALALGASAVDLPLALQFEEVQPSVWERAVADGVTEQVASGPEGLAWALTQLHDQSTRELELYLQDSTAARWSRIKELAKTMEQIRADISTARGVGLANALQYIEERNDACGYTYQLTAEADPLYPGAQASSSSDWFGACGQTATVYCYAYAEVDAVHDSESKSGSGSDLDRSCAASVSGSGDCYSYARSYVYSSSLSLYVQKTATNTDCGSTPLATTLSCGVDGYPGYSCTATASGGTPPYRAYWKVDSYSEYEDTGGAPWDIYVVCKYLPPHNQTVTIRSRITDSNGGEKIRTHICADF